jgi:hypothetical protein
VLAAAVGAEGVPVNVGDVVSALLATAVAIALYSSSISAPLIILLGLPVSKASFVKKFVALT